MGSLDRSPEWATEPIAIIGMSCKFAGEASNPGKLWELMAEGRNAWSKIPESRYGHQGQYHPEGGKRSTNNVKGAHFIKEDVSLFDAAFFGFPAELASALDPQFRIQLESTYEALENAGLPLSQVAGSNTSVYASVFTHDYYDGIMRDGDNLPRSTLVGTFSAMASNRISHFYDLHGPSMSIDTGCSGALVSLHQAVMGLRSREADMSIVCGSTLLLAPDCFKLFSSVGMLSPDGKCYAFDSRANGYGRGEGVGSFVIKRLSDAIAAGDPIRAVIRESALNQDGKSETITSPSQDAQIRLMRDAYRRAGLSPNDTQYFEAHGTGTPTGDGVETRSIANVFGSHSTGRQAPLLVGSVKTNLGHTEAASGIAALVKVVLALEKGQIPPSVNFEKPNPNLKLDECGLKVVTGLQKWPTSSEGQKLRASVNNFGYGGTNSHVILEDARAFLPQSSTASQESLFSGPGGAEIVMYGRDEQACKRMVAGVKDYLHARVSTTTNPVTLVENLAWTLGQRRTRFPSGWISAHTVRWSGDGNVLKEVVQCLDEPQFKPARIPGDNEPRIGMVFTGQGAQWHAMGRELVDAYPVFRSALQEAEGYLREFGADWSLQEELMRDAAATRVNETGLSIPICVALQIALVHLLSSWGIRPSAVTSHSSGEISAAYAAGALNLRQAMATAYHRSAMAANMTMASRGPKGAMAALGVGQDAALKYLEQLDEATTGKAGVACVNSPNSVTLAGDETAVLKMLELAEADGVFARRLRVETGYHSHHMVPIAEAYRNALAASLGANDEKQNETLPIIFSSPVTGGRILTVQQLNSPDHWVGSLLQPVEFVKSFQDMVVGDRERSTGYNVDVLVEVGPHTALGGPIKEILATPEFQGASIPYFGCLVRKENARDCMINLALSLLRNGQQLDLTLLRVGPLKEQLPTLLTDLPSYPWNHGVSHWVESRHSRSYRARQGEFHHLLGFLVPGANPDAPRWRQQVRLTDSPWLRDHVVQGSILYPGAGYICLATEAMKQLTSQSQDGVFLSGFTLRNVDFLNALVVPDSNDGIEVHTLLHADDDKAIGTHGWRKWEVYSVTEDSRWTKHAIGWIQATFEVPQASQKTTEDHVSELGPVRTIDPEEMWSNLRALGLNHGPSFRNITSILQDGRAMDTRRCVTTIGTTEAGDPHDRHVIHPATLDSVVVSSIVALPHAGAQDLGPRVPRSMQKLWISSQLPSAPGSEFRCNTTLTDFDAQRLRGDLLLLDGAEPVIEMQGLVCHCLGSTASPQPSEPWKTELCSKVKWAPDLALSLGLTGASQALEEQANSSSGKVGLFQKDLLTRLRRVCVYFCQDAVKDLTEQDVAQLEPGSAKYYTWMKRVLQDAAERRLSPDSDNWLNDSPRIRKKNIALATSQSVEGELTCRLGTVLGSILKGTQPLFEVLTTNMIDRYKSNAFRSASAFSHLSSLLKNVTHKSPRARILQIGLTAGAPAHRALQSLIADAGASLAGSWHFTDKSSLHFDTVKGALSDELEMKFDVLDIEKSPIDQGFQPESYDIVLAVQTLHQTQNLGQSLAHIHSLMKPGGQLLLGETTQTQVDQQFVFGLLPSWWERQDDERKEGPHLSTPKWQHVLTAQGFNGVQAEWTDGYEAEEDLHTYSTIITSVSDPVPETSEAPVMIIISDKSSVPTSWLEALRKSVAKMTDGSLPNVQKLEAASASSLDGKACLFLGEADKPLLYTLDGKSMEGIKVMINSCKTLLWITRGGSCYHESPDMSLAAGFLRVARSESAGSDLVSLDLDPDQQTWTQSSAQAIVHLLERRLLSAKLEMQENEFAFRGNLLMIPRLIKEPTLNTQVSPVTRDRTLSDAFIDKQLVGADTDLRLVVGTPGQLESVVFEAVSEPVYAGDAEDDMVEIEPRGFGINTRDIRAAMGQTQDKTVGSECAGVLTRVGPMAAEQGFSVGDRVMALLHGHVGSRVRVQWRCVVHVPKQMDFHTAASLPNIFTTAYMALVDIGRLRSGESVLVHGAAGDVGQAAVVLAKDYIGAKDVYATVSSQKERELLIRQYGVLEDHVFSTEDTSFTRAILEATGRRGVDVVVNSLSGRSLQAAFDIIAPFGRFIDLTTQDREGHSLLDMTSFSRAASFASFDLGTVIQERPDDVQRVLTEIARITTQGIVRLVHPFSVRSVQDVASVFQEVNLGKLPGKVILSVNPEDNVKALPLAASPKLKADASYVLAGGTGGIGRSIAHWMVEKGARNIILLSRSAGDASKTGPYVASLQAAGCRVVAMSCDVANKNDLERVLQACAIKEKMPPVRGVINSAMALQDCLFEQMTLAQWQTSIQPKVAATWNLHSQFNQPDSLDFFVMLSSVSGIIGTATQANYAAGCAYQDALAHRRQAMGLPAVSLDLGIVKDVGYASVSETRAVLDSWRRSGQLVILGIEDVLRSFAAAVMNPPGLAQVVVGLNTGPGSHWNSDMGRDARFQTLRQRPTSEESGQGGEVEGGESLSADLKQAGSLEKAKQLVSEAITAKLADIFMIPAEDVNLSKAPADYGVDSLVAVELRTMLTIHAGAEVSIFNILQSKSLATLADDAVAKSKFVSKGAA